MERLEPNMVQWVCYGDGLPMRSIRVLSLLKAGSDSKGANPPKKTSVAYRIPLPRRSGALGHGLLGRSWTFFMVFS
jgi:hypothetical protein